MELSLSADLIRLETALQESKETSLAENVTKNSVIESNMDTHSVCRICGKVLQHLSKPASSEHSEQIKIVDCCAVCATSGETPVTEVINRRDSGFHTMNWQSQSIDDSQSQLGLIDTRTVGSDDTPKVADETNFNKFITDTQITTVKPDASLKQHQNHSTDKSLAKDAFTPKAFAENLFNCNGYKRTEVARILGKNSRFNEQVAEEYLRFFDFTDDTIISSYRYFLSQFALLGETQERERVLSYFSKRYMECNPDSLDKNSDSVHTLVCALTLLNTDLHGNIAVPGRKKMTYKQFVANLSGLMSDGSDYPKDLLVSLYTSIKKNPLPWGGKEQKAVSRSSSVKHKANHQFARSPGKMVSRSMSTRTPNKLHKTVVDSSRTGLGRSANHKPLMENQGTLWRKTMLDSDGKKVSMGKRGWRIFTVTLRNLELHIAKKGSGEVKTSSIHHSIAEETTSESKRANVFKLMHADTSVVLYQASSDKEMRRWIREINRAAALLSAAPLCSPVGSQMVFRKALLPSAPSTLPPINQLKKLQQLLKENEDDLADTSKSINNSTNPPTSHLYITDKVNYLNNEIMKYKCYVEVLQMHLRVNSSSLEELKSNLNGSVVSVTPSEPPLASPSAIDTFNNLAFSDTSEKVPVLAAPAHFTTPQHRSSALSPTSSLPNLSPILESPSILHRGDNGVKVRAAGLYESSLNEGDFITANNVNNSNGIVGLAAGDHTNHPTFANPWIRRSERRFSSEENVQTPRCKAEIQTTVIGMTALPGDREPFPVKRYEMRIADMDSQSMSPTVDLVNKNLSRVKGRKEKKGIERYSYLQAVSPFENHN